MSTLLAIVAATLIGGILSVAGAALTLGLRAAWVGKFVAFAVGALLGAVFLDILPHAIESVRASGQPVEPLFATVLAGVFLFFLLEKFVIWRHSHEHGHHANGDATVPAAAAELPDGGHDNEHGRSGWMILIGDTFHNFCDGIVIAAAFLADFNLGVVTAAAIIAHEVPQEVGDFLVLLHSGFSKRQALVFNMASSLGSVLGGLIGYFALATVRHWVPYALAFAAASMIYVAVADLIPGLQRRIRPSETLQQVVLIALGIAVIALVRHVLEP